MIQIQRSHLALVFLGVLFVDQISKFLVQYNQAPYILNTGFAMGGFQGVGSILKVSLACAISSYLTALGLIILGLLSRFKHVKLKLGLILFIAAINSNVIDRVRLGGVIDFIPLGKSHYFANIADLFLVIGLLLILYSLIFNSKALFFDKDQRGTWLVEKKYQLTFAFCMAIGIGIQSLCLIFFSYPFLKLGKLTTPQMQSFVIVAIILTAISSLIGFLFMIILTNFSAGPLFRLKRNLRENNDDEVVPRKSDFHKELFKFINQKIRKP